MSTHCSNRMSLTSCNESQFNCASAFCLSMDMRCDGRIDCKDKSDEKDCALIQVNFAFNQSSSNNNNIFFRRIILMSTGYLPRLYPERREWRYKSYISIKPKRGFL